MNRILSYLILLCSIFLFGIALVSCEDELEYPGLTPIEEGVSSVDVSVGFKQFTPALDSRAAGNAIKSIDRLWVVIYDKDRNFVRKQEILNFTVKENQENTRPDGQLSSETKTGHAEFKLTLENGYYYMYAVANHPGMATVTDDDISTPEKLRKLDLEWKSGDVKQNSEMFGWFVNGDKNTAPGTDAQLVTIKDNTSRLHAWVRRAASKVTIAFNTVKMSDNVRVYLKSVTIKDIPKHCPLSDDNAPSSKDELTDGETIYFGEAKASDTGKADHHKWKRIHSGDSVYGLFSDDKTNGMAPSGTPVKDRLTREHGEGARALYFYENLQGVADLKNCPWQDKRQDVSGNNKQVSYPEGVFDTDKAWKDGKEYGSYIEIRGYYENQGSTSPGRGDIIYRFMLGKNITDDFNAERNYHYQLTMNFNGNANDIDFHIDYREEAKPGLLVQDTTYVSYLYNQESGTTVRATPRPGYDLMSIKAYVLRNEWRPYEGASTMYNKEAWDWQMSFSNDYAEKPSGKYARPTAKYNPSWTDFNGKKHQTYAANNTEFGYLSLRKVTRQVYELGGSGNKQNFVAKMRKLYFLGNENASNSATGMDKSRGYRNYGSLPANDGTYSYGTPEDGFYTVTRRPSNKTPDKTEQTNDYIINVPFYTRAMSIDSWAVYSGANPFYRHHRYARVVFIATYTKSDPDVAGPATYQEADSTHVLQARRIDNPRAIYRRRENTQPFHVVLCYNKKTAEQQLLDAQGTTPFAKGEEIFEPIKSRGPWKAYIERDPHGLVKLTAGTQECTGPGDTIRGRENTAIDFTYTPNAIPPVGKAYGAIITIRYHNNSCTHKIIVRQGYDACGINAATTRWSLFNVYNETELTKSPLSIGSTYRRNSKWGNLIKESNNKRSGFGVEVYPPLNKKFWIHGTNQDKGWYAIPHDSVDVTKDFFGTKGMKAFNGATYQYQLPQGTHLKTIGIYFNKTDVTQTDPDVEDKGNAFGIAYADGATQTSLTKDAYSFYDPDNSITDSPMGVRCVVVYSLATGDNILFPFGCFGNPRRRDRGWLQYGSVGRKLSGGANNYRPMAYDLLYQVGGTYWIATTDKTHVAIDFNGGNYMSSYLNAGDVYQQGATNTNPGAADALPIKLIRVSD